MLVTIKRFHLFLFVLVSLCSLGLTAQEESKTNYTYDTFEGTRVVVGHSVELLKEGEMDFLISHRFGRVSDGINEFFGLDNAILRLGFDYGINDKINIGIGRSSLDKLVDGFVKVGLLRQQTGTKNIPISLTGLATMGVTTVEDSVEEPLTFENRLSYTYQLMLARKFGERFSLQIAPTITHFNLVDTRNLENDVLSIGAAAKYQISKAWSIKGEYYYALPNQLAANKENSFALGFDFDTGSHIFQLHFSNTGGLVEPAFLGGTTGKWLEGDIQFGFTISRVFKLKGRRY